MAVKESKAAVSAGSISAGPEIISGFNSPSELGNIQSQPEYQNNDERVEVNLPDPTSENISEDIPENTDNSLLLSLRLEKKRIIPYTTFLLQNWQINEVRNILKIKKLQKQVNQKISKNLYDITSLDEAGNDLVTSTLNDISEEIENTEKVISAVKSLKITYDNVSNSYVKNYYNNMHAATNLLKTYVDSLSVDPICKQDIMQASDYIALLVNNMAYNSAKLYKRSNSELIMQVYKDLDFTLRIGLSPSFFMSSYDRHIPGNSYEQIKQKYSDPWSNGVSSRVPSLKRLDFIGIRDDAGYEGLLRNNPEKRFPNLEGLSSIEKVMYHSAILSKEFLYSAGLGRLIGSPLGEKYGSSGEDPINQLLGARGNVTLTNPGSINTVINYLITKEDANPDTNTQPAGKNVHVLERHLRNNLNSGLNETSKVVWADTVKSDPFNNKMDDFLNAMDQLVHEFEDTQEYISKFLSYDQEKTLLTPRGLFTRILKDFGTLLEAITVESDDTIRKKVLTEMAVLSLAGQTTNGSNHEQVPYGGDKIRRSLTFFLGVQSIIRRGGYDDTPWVEEQAGFEAFDGGSSEAIDEIANGLIRITGKDNIRRSGLETKVRDIKKLLQDSIMTSARSYNEEDPAQDPDTTKEIRVKGQKIVEIFSSHGTQESAATGVESIIVKIFEDLQAEAHDLSQIEGPSSSYIRAGRTTLHAGFDGQLVMTSLLTCFIQLVSTFVDVKLVLDFETSAAMAIWKLGLLANGITSDEPTDPVVEFFNAGNHKVYFHADDNQNNSTNKLRQFISALTNASNSNDFSNLINSSGVISTIPSLSQNDNLADGPYAIDGVVVPLTMIDAMNKLADEDAAPAVLLGSVKSVVEVMQQNLQPLALKAAALKTNDASSSDTDDIATLKELSESSLTVNFLEGITNSQIHQAQHRLKELKDAHAENEAYVISPVNNSMFEIYNMLLDEKSSEFTNAAILFVGMPNSSISSSLLEQEIQTSGVLAFNVEKIDDSKPNEVYIPKTFDFLLRYSLTTDNLIQAMNSDPKPANLEDLLGVVKFEVENTLNQVGQAIPGSEIIDNYNDKSIARRRLMNLLESTILKSMYQQLSGVPLEAHRVLKRPLETRSNKVVNLAQKLTLPIISSKESVSRFFMSQDGGVKMPDQVRRESLTQPQKAIISGSLVYKKSLMTFPQLEAIYDLQSTVPFFVNKIDDIVFSESIFDKMEGLFVDLDDFNIDHSAVEYPYQNSISLPMLFVGASLSEDIL